MHEVVIDLVSERFEDDQLSELLLGYFTDSFLDLDLTTIFNEEPRLYGSETFVLILLHDLFEVSGAVEEESNIHSTIIYRITKNKDCAKSTQLPPSTIIGST